VHSHASDYAALVLFVLIHYSAYLYDCLPINVAVIHVCPYATHTAIIMLSINALIVVCHLPEINVDVCVKFFCVFDFVTQATDIWQRHIQGGPKISHYQDSSFKPIKHHQ